MLRAWFEVNNNDGDDDGDDVGVYDDKSDRSDFSRS